MNAGGVNTIHNQQLALTPSRAPQSEARKREEAERERARKEREGQGQAQGPGQGGRASSGNGQAGGGGSAFRGTTASEAGIQDAASDQSKGSSTARS